VRTTTPAPSTPHIPTQPERPRLHRLATRLADVRALDAPAYRVLSVLGRVVRPGGVRDTLSGTFLGHPLHPLLTDLPIGAWMSALALDATTGRRGADAARRLVGLGVLAALPTAASGAVEWGDSARARPSTRRVGIVHAAANATALMLFAASYLRRRDPGAGRGLSLAGAGALTIGGFLGGHLSYVHGEGVARTTFEPDTREWTATMPISELGEGEMASVTVQGVPVLIAEHEGSIYALADHCTHRGGPLHEGTLADGCVTCPWHGSRFRLADGAVDHGPASSPQPAYETRVRDGRIEIRQVTHPTP
jgi:nitrite reductase/ring-hydroxylating ferredoxin subunit/uncharacterized membrane protein